MKKLNKKLLDFNKSRGWKPTAGDCVKSIIIEASELLEHYQWNETDILRDKKSPKKPDKNKTAKEVADIYWYLNTFCFEEEINLEEALELKLEHNNKKYPLEKFNGKFNEIFYNERKKEYRKKKIN